MPFTLDKYFRVRPFLYHLTVQENIGRIRSLKRLESAKTFLNEAARKGEIRARRSEKMSVFVNADRVFLRDQAPLHHRNIAFKGGWKLEDLTESLNCRVFFWSGWEHAPIPHGKRHFDRYSSEYPVVIRARFDSMRDKNPERTPLFCKFNSGSPRRYQGRGSPRGPNTFLPGEYCLYDPGEVVEVTFLESIALPNDTEVSSHAESCWAPLFDRN